MKRSQKRRSNGQKEMNRMVNSIDALAKFEEFCDEILPALRADLDNNKSADEIYSKYTSLAAARAVTIAAREPDSAKALAAVKEILDRNKGKATEKKEVQHKFAQLKDEQLDAVLVTELGDMQMLSEGDGDE